MINSSEIKQKIWRKLNNLRSTSNCRLGEGKILELIGATKGIEALDSILDHEKVTQLLAHDNEILPPLYVFNFVNEIAKSVDPKSHLDPWITPSSPCNFFDFGQTIAYSLNESAIEVINTFFPNDNNQICLGDISEELKYGKTNFDLITSFTPFGVRQREEIKIDGVSLPMDFGFAIMIQSSLLLSETGKAVFFASPFINNKDKEILSGFGLFVDAVFTVPSGALLPTTGMTSNLIVITKQAKIKTFVAEISTNEESNKVILANYKARKASKETRLGALVEFKEFNSLQSLIAKKEAKELGQRLGYEPINLDGELALYINAIKQTSKDEVEHLSNSIYLPKIGNSSVVTNPSEMRIKPTSYFQIQLDDTKANAVYMANYLNSDIGKKIRKSLESGAYIPQISKTELSSCTLHLPDLSTQLTIIDVDNKISQISLQVEALKRELWRQPKKYASITKSLNDINKEEKIEHWIDALPFPLSSILWLYYATNDNSKKIIHLFHFFEALSEFFSMIMLSALIQDQNPFRQEVIDSIGAMHEKWYEKASFGNWQTLASILSKLTRGYYNHKEKREICKSLFGSPSDSFLDMLTQSGIITILADINERRNEWKGHGGLANKEEEKQRVIILEQSLNELRKFIADGFEETKIISPISGILKRGMHTYSVKELVGARTPFNETHIESSISLDEEKLYLIHSDQCNPVELLPFIKFVESKGAVYFYTSIKSNSVTWVSYHYHSDSQSAFEEEINDDLNKVFAFLESCKKPTTVSR